MNKLWMLTAFLAAHAYADEAQEESRTSVPVNDNEVVEKIIIVKRPAHTAPQKKPASAGLVLGNNNLQPAPVLQSPEMQGAYVPRSGGFRSIDVHYLFWSAYEDNLQMAVKGVNDSSIAEVDSGKAYTLPTNWRSGARAGTSFSFPNRSWDLEGSWTWFMSDNKRTVHSDETTFAPNNLQAVWSSDVRPATNVNAIQKVNERWDLHYNTADLHFKRWFDVGTDFSVAANFGVRAVWIYQTLRVHNLPILEAQEDFISDELIRMKSDFAGIGLRAGAYTAYELCPSWRVFGAMNISLIYGRFNVSRVDTVTGSTVDPTNAHPPYHPVHLRERVNSLKPQVEAAMGFSWDMKFGQDDWGAVRIDIAYEFQLWLSQNRFIKFVTGNTPGNYYPDGGDLFLQGGVIGASVLF